MIKINQESYVLMFKMFLKKECTATDLVDETGLHRNTVGSFLKCLKKHKLIHITEWEPDALGRDSFAVYKMGNKPDKKRYKMTGQERTARYRAKNKIREQLRNTYDSTIRQVQGMAANQHPQP